MNLSLEGFPKGIQDFLLWLVPIGAGFDWWGDPEDVPRGYILAYGQDIFPQKYPKLYRMWTRKGTTNVHGAGTVAGSTKAPDKRGRGSIAKDDMGGTAANRVTNAVSGITATTLGATGGDQRLHGHTHGPGSIGKANGNFGSGSGTAGIAISGDAGPVSTFAMDTGVTASTGGGASENMPPVIVCNYIIRAG